MTRNSQAPRREPTADDIMVVLKDAYMLRNAKRLWIPDAYAQIPDLQRRIEHWVSFSILCGESQHDDLRNGTWMCSVEEGHNSPHYGGGLEVTTTNTNNDPGMGAA